jgi:hypothetical protein
MLSGIISDAPVELGLLSGEEEANGGAASHVVHETISAQPTSPVGHSEEAHPAPQTQPQAQPQRPEPKTVEELAEWMTLDEAKNVKVDFGRYAGNTLGQIAMIKPADLQWYVEHYSGANKAIKAGAMVLLRSAQKMAS